VLALAFPAKAGGLTSGGFPSFPFPPLFKGVGGPQMYCMFPIFSVDGIHRLIEEASLLGAEGIFEEGIRGLALRVKLEENDASSPIEKGRMVKGGKLLPQDRCNLEGITGGTAEFCLYRSNFKVLPLEEGEQPRGCQLVTAGLDTGRFQVSHELGV